MSTPFHLTTGLSEPSGPGLCGQALRRHARSAMKRTWSVFADAMNHLVRAVTVQQSSGVTTRPGAERRYTPAHASRSDRSKHRKKSSLTDPGAPQ